MQFSIQLSRLVEWCKMFQSWQLHFTAWHGLLYLQCCLEPCFKTVASSDFLFFTVLVTSLGPSLQSSTQYQQSFPCCTVCLVWLALGAREIPLPRSGPTTDDLKSRDEFAGGTCSYQSEIDGRIAPAAATCPTICTICCQLYHSDYCAAASARNFTAFMLLTTNDSSIYVPTTSSTLLFNRPGVAGAVL